jgi:predicted alpha/beta-fold hydrolase
LSSRKRESAVTAVQRFDVSTVPTFRPRAPWWGADLQTLRNVLPGGAPGVALQGTEQLSLPLLDETGDVLSASLNHPDTAAGSDNPLIVLIHGLSGSDESAYILASADYWLARGHRVLRLNLRGAGSSRATCSQQYHAGRTQDLRDALSGLPHTLTTRGVVLVGYSLGGNMLLKFLAEYGSGFHIHAAASVSAPIDLAAASERFLDRRNWVYHQHLLRNMKRECFGGTAEISAAERMTISACKSIYEFDELVVAPRNGYRDAAHYYWENHSRRQLERIETPTLLVHAMNDPWIPSAAYTSYPWHENPHLHPLLTSGGGHVGFHAGTTDVPYHDHCIGEFLDAVTG